jgi:hypothetical protein
MVAERGRRLEYCKHAMSHLEELNWKHACISKEVRDHQQKYAGHGYVPQRSLIVVNREGAAMPDSTSCRMIKMIAASPAMTSSCAA